MEISYMKLLIEIKVTPLGGLLEIVSVLNTCLSCDAMAIDSSSQIVADSSRYELLRKFFKEIGDPVYKNILDFVS
ncbi:hypothetical protein D3C87_481670 [compost metagenome]